MGEDTAQKLNERETNTACRKKQKEELVVNPPLPSHLVDRFHVVFLSCQRGKVGREGFCRPAGVRFGGLVRLGDLVSSSTETKQQRRGGGIFFLGGGVRGDYETWELDSGAVLKSTVKAEVRKDRRVPLTGYRRRLLMTARTNASEWIYLRLSRLSGGTIGAARFYVEIL